MATTPTINIALTQEQAEALRSQLNEVAMEMDDDGREGAFAASPLSAVLAALRQAMPRRAGR